eukprot:g45883.t1
MPPSASLALQTQINDFLNGLSSRQEKSDGHLGARQIQPGTPSSKLKTETSINSIKLSALKHPNTKHVSISEKPTVLDEANGRENQGVDGQTEQEASDVETDSSNQAQGQSRSRESTSSPPLSACHENPGYDSEFYAPDGLPRTMHTMPSFLEAFAEAKKARYIRHRTKPEDERELSISEIFAKRKDLARDITVKEDCVITVIDLIFNMRLDILKCQAMTVSNKEESNHHPLTFKGISSTEFPTIDINGVTIDQKLNLLTIEREYLVSTSEVSADTMEQMTFCIAMILLLILVSDYRFTLDMVLETILSNAGTAGNTDASLTLLLPGPLAIAATELFNK